jgi:FAD/FMN-containing dehydrogenase
MSALTPEQVQQQLAELVSPAKVLTDPASLADYGQDWTRVYDPCPIAVVLPTTIEQVQALVNFALQHTIALVPSGGRTGLSGGAVACQGEVVVSFAAMNKILDFNAADQTLRCQPGLVTEQLQQFAQQKGLFYPVDFASSGSSQIGGNIATNAGGIQVIRYGSTRQWVAGLKVVTGTGELLTLNHGLVKNAAGYDLRHLFIGSEGTLGLIVEATIKLTRPPKALSVLVLGVPQFAAILSVLEAFQQQLDLTAFEFFSEQALAKVVAHHQLSRPFAAQPPFYALLEFENLSETVLEQAMTVFEHCMEQGWVVDGVMSQSENQRLNLWRLREDISETIAVHSPYKNDLSVLTSRLSDFIQKAEVLVNRSYPDFEIIWFGHIGDGNLHLNILKPETMEKTVFIKHCEQVNEQLFQLVAELGGSISAEHGIGLLKRDYLHFSRSAEEIKALAGIKKVFDPAGILNPGKLIPPVN